MTEATRDEETGMTVEEGSYRHARTVRRRLLEGMAIPAHPLALDAERRLDEKRQRGLGRYYTAAGAGGLAVGVHTTQFSIRRPDVGLLRPVLEIASSVVRESGRRPLLIAGVCGATGQALAEAELARSLGYDAALVSLGALPDAPESDLVLHCAEVARVIPILGFYLQPAVGGRVLSRGFWRSLALIEDLVAIKVAPFNRYQTLDVLRAVAESGRAGEIALYTGNDDHIVDDLLMSATFGGVTVRFHGGLLGQWAVGTCRAAGLVREALAHHGGGGPHEALSRVAFELTDTNAALFDAANGFRGCIAGIHEVLRRQGMLVGTWCLDPDEALSPGQSDEITRVLAAYPHLHDDSFIEQHRDTWLA